ncbi:MAG: trans-aconitate 2-methyltransferase [Methanomassiliicoccales archaeon]
MRSQNRDGKKEANGWISKKLYSFKRRMMNQDDYDWQRYNTKYSAQLADLDGKYSTVLPDDKYTMVDGRLVVDPSVPPLHPNHKLLYETIYGLRPDSILEVGCGGGDHLENLRMILPGSEVMGCDLLDDQIRTLHIRHPDLEKIFVHDITESAPNTVVDLVYTQAVIMHIHRDDRHLNALKNMARAARSYIVLMENWGSHNFYDDMMTISKDPDFPWDECHLYKRDDGEQILMIASNRVLDGYDKLNNNKELMRYLRH